MQLRVDFGSKRKTHLEPGTSEMNASSKAIRADQDAAAGRTTGLLAPLLAQPEDVCVDPSRDRAVVMDKRGQLFLLQCTQRPASSIVRFRRVGQKSRSDSEESAEDRAGSSRLGPGR